MDLQEGGTVTLNNGKELVIEPHEGRVHGSLWQNGAMIEVFYHKEIPDDFDPSDRMEIKITDCNGFVKGWHLNMEDALELIEGLSKAMKLCGENRVPYNPEINMPG